MFTKGLQIANTYICSATSQVKNKQIQCEKPKTGAAGRRYCTAKLLLLKVYDSHFC